MQQFFSGPQTDQDYINWAFLLDNNFSQLFKRPFTPGGTTTQLQYNLGGAFAGIAGSVWDGTSLTLPELISAGNTLTINIATPFLTRIGYQALDSASGINNTGFGYQAGTPIIAGSGNTIAGHRAMATAGPNASNNVAVGVTSLFTVEGNNNTGVGLSTLQALGGAGAQCTALGYGAGYYSGATLGAQTSTNAVTTAQYGTFIGFQTSPSSTTPRNYQTVIGAGALGFDAANTVTLGLIGTDTVYTGTAVIGKKTVSSNNAVTDLPAPSAALTGARSFVMDSNATLTAGIGGIVAGSGANIVPVFCNGTNWLIA